MQERAWLAHYPEGIPAEIDLSRYTSLVALMEQELRRAQQFEPVRGRRRRRGLRLAWNGFLLGLRLRR